MDIATTRKNRPKGRFFEKSPTTNNKVNNGSWPSTVNKILKQSSTIGLDIKATRASFKVIKEKRANKTLTNVES